MLTAKRFSALRLFMLAVALVGFSWHTTLAQESETPVQQVFESSANYKVALWAPHAVFRRDGAELVVHVRNGQGQLLDGLPVQFQLDPAWHGNASISPRHVLTHHGTARATLQTDLIGVVQVTAHVGTITKQASIAVSLYDHGSTSAN